MGKVKCKRAMNRLLNRADSYIATQLGLASAKMMRRATRVTDDTEVKFGVNPIKKEQGPKGKVPKKVIPLPIEVVGPEKSAAAPAIEKPKLVLKKKQA